MVPPGGAPGGATAPDREPRSGPVPLRHSLAELLTGPGMVAAVFGIWAQAIPPRTAPVSSSTEEADHD